MSEWIMIPEKPLLERDLIFLGWFFWLGIEDPHKPATPMPCPETTDPLTSETPNEINAKKIACDPSGGAHS
jgi:hypothetical protein